MSRHVSVAPKPFAALPKRQREFVKEYVRSGDAKSSYVAVGYKDSRTSMAKAAELLKHMQPYLQQAHRDFLEGVEMGILGAKVVRELAEHGKNETVRLNAAKELLDRSVPETPKESTVTHIHKTMSNDEMDKRIQELQDKLFIDVPKAEVVAIHE